MLAQHLDAGDGQGVVSASCSKVTSASRQAVQGRLHGACDWWLSKEEAVGSTGALFLRTGTAKPFGHLPAMTSGELEGRWAEADRRSTHQVLAPLHPCGEPSEQPCWRGLGGFAAV